MIGALLAGALGLGMGALGVAATAFPGPSSALYGVPQRDAAGQAWVRAAGLRDLALAGVIGLTLMEGQPRAAGWVAVATACVAAADACNVLATRGCRALPLGVHASGIGMGLLAGALLLTGPGAERAP